MSNTTCPRCGTPLSAGQRFCPSCGAPAGGQPVGPAPPPANYQTAPQQSGPAPTPLSQPVVRFTRLRGAPRVSFSLAPDFPPLLNAIPMILILLVLACSGIYFLVNRAAQGVTGGLSTPVAGVNGATQYPVTFISGAKTTTQSPAIAYEVISGTIGFDAFSERAPVGMVFLTVVVQTTGHEPAGTTIGVDNFHLKAPGAMSRPTIIDPANKVVQQDQRQVFTMAFTIPAGTTTADLVVGLADKDTAPLPLDLAAKP